MCILFGWCGEFVDVVNWIVLFVLLLVVWMMG